MKKITFLSIILALLAMAVTPGYGPERQRQQGQNRP